MKKSVFNFIFQQTSTSSNIVQLSCSKQRVNFSIKFIIRSQINHIYLNYNYGAVFLNAVLNCVVENTATNWGVKNIHIIEKTEVDRLQHTVSKKNEELCRKQE